MKEFDGTLSTCSSLDERNNLLKILQDALAYLLKHIFKIIDMLIMSSAVKTKLKAASLSYTEFLNATINDLICQPYNGYTDKYCKDNIIFCIDCLLNLTCQ